MKKITVVVNDLEFICTQSKKFVEVYHDDKYVGHIIDVLPDINHSEFNEVLLSEFEERITNFATLVFFAHSEPIAKEKYNEIKTNLIKSYMSY